MVRRQNQRQAFTLTELMIVIGIILVIAAFGLGAAAKGYGWMQQRATETTFKKVLARFNSRVMTRLAKEADEWPTVDAIRAQAGDNAARARAIKMEYLYRWSFPTSYAEVVYNVLESRVYYSNISTVGYPTAVRILDKISSNVPAASWNAAYTSVSIPYLRFQNAVCLAAAYEVSPNSSQDELSAAELVQAPGGFEQDTNRGVSDSWGQPLFYIRYGASNANNTTAVSQRWTIFFPNAYTSQVPPMLAPLDLGVNAGSPPSQRYLPNMIGSNVLAELIARSNVGNIGRANNPSGAISFSDPEGLLQLGSWTGDNTASTYWPEGLPNGPPNNNILNFTRTFGVPPNQGNYAPMVIFSSGSDRNWETWGDNLDSYRVQSSVSGQQ